MSLSRRALFGLGAETSAPLAQLVTARGREAMVAELGPLAGESGLIPPPQRTEIRLTSNENPLGPPPPAMSAIRETFMSAGRYPTNAQPNTRDLTEALAEKHGCEPNNIVLGAGSGELLKNAAHAFTGPDRLLVTATPSYLATKRVAEYLGADVKALAVTADGHLDLDAMASAGRGAGLIFFCNPNNPTGTVHGDADLRSFVRTIRRTSPNTVIHFDEAYHEYVTDPDYKSGLEISLETPNVFVSRTFSKCFGMAGMRVGYAVGHRDMMATMRRYQLTFNTSTVSVAGAHAGLQMHGFTERERRRNTEARSYTIEFFKQNGYEVFDSHTNFIFAHIGSPAAEFRSACRQRGVGVGRDFPPMEKTHARISIGTLDEMKRACEVFKEVLA